MKLKIIRLFFAAAALSILLASCEARREERAPEEETPTESVAMADDGRIYRIWLDDNSYWFLDSDGNDIPQRPDFSELVDLSTGETKYQYLTRYEDTGIRDEWGNPEAKILHSLYDTEGNTLIDWEEMDYREGFGDYIIRQDSSGMMMDIGDMPEDYRSALYHLPTKTEVYDDVHSVSKLDDNTFLLLGRWNSPLGIVDSEGRVISGFPPPTKMYSAYGWKGYFIATTMNPYERTEKDLIVEYLFDRDFNEIYSGEWLSAGYGNIRGDYIACRNTYTGWDIFHPEEGIVFATTGSSVEYFDGDRAILQTGSYRSVDDPIKASLVTAEGDKLAEGFSWLVPAQPYGATELAVQFLGILDSKLVMIDREGKTLLESAIIPGAKSLYVLADDLYSCYIESETFYGDCLLDSALEMLLPMGSYSSMNLIADHSLDYNRSRELSGSCPLVAYKAVGSDEPGGQIYRMDILDRKGNIIIDNVSSIYDAGPNRIALKRGFYIGLIDWEGNWIVKRSIFQGFGID